MSKTIILDTETTGLLLPSGAELEQQPYIIDIGMVIAVKVGDELTTATYSQLVKPPVPLQEKITKITGITDDMLKDQPAFVDVLPKIIELLSSADTLIAHNAKFDVGMLTNEVKRAYHTNPSLAKQFKLPKNIICTVEEFQGVFGYKPKLTEVWEYVFQNTLDEQHRALSDAMDLFKICSEVGLIE